MNIEHLSINTIFNGEPKPPFSVKIDLFSNEKNDIVGLFTKIKELYIKGMIITRGGVIGKGNNNLEADKVTPNDICIMEQHMLSFGLKTVYIKLNNDSKNALFKHLLYELGENIPKLNFTVTLDWRTQFINKIDFKLPGTDQKNILLQINKIMLNHNVANFFLKISKGTRLKDFGVIITQGENITVIYFDHDNIADHQKIHRCQHDKIRR
tara:strand:- start:655 stop:1284 length:630 start_codon:yes stop_codon:yes gene_type:complete